MQITPYPSVNKVLQSLLTELPMVLEDNLVGVYLFGSLMAGDFDETISDIDLLVAIAKPLDPASFNALDQMHQRVTQQFPQWEGRLELAYATISALKTFRTEPYKIGIISPGEPFHIIDSSEGWLMNWYLVQETGQTLWGKPQTEIIDPISKAEYMQNVKTHMLAWHNWLQHAPDKSFLSYAVLTLSRGLYTLVHQEPASKVKACIWAKNTYPQWGTLIENALQWRYDTTIDDLTTEEIQPQVNAFLTFVIENLPK